MKCKFALILAILALASAATAKERREGRELEKYFDRWLNEDVVYIITQEEREVFNKLTTPEEKEKFIEQFWLRRDPSPGTIQNEFKEEHYRRIAYANERYQHGGVPGWKTDRGRIYITYGPPTEIEAHPSGGPYNRPMHEGGGGTVTFPFEVWRYRYIEGLGGDIEIEFVDPSWSGEYRIAMSPDEKDALLFTPRLGPTFLERIGLRRKEDRPRFTPGNTNNAAFQAMSGLRAKDRPFARMEQFFNLQRPPEIKFKDLRAAVETQITYNQLPFRVRQDLIRLSPDRAVVPITLEVNNSDITFKQNLNVATGQVNAYGSVRSLTGHIVAEFEDVLNADVPAGQLEWSKRQKSIYQKLVILEPGLYKLDLILKDVNSGRVGNAQMRISVPRAADDKLYSSTLILAGSISPFQSLSDQPQQFVLGDLKVVPKVEPVFRPDESLGVYLQLYNVALDQATLAPSISVDYLIMQGNKMARAVLDSGGNSVQFFSSERTVLARNIPLKGLAPGRYKLKVKVADNISGQTLAQEAEFEIAASS